MTYYFYVVLACCREVVSTLWIDFRLEVRRAGQFRRHAWRLYLLYLAGLPMLWTHLFRVRTARRICIEHHDNGFFANVLAVLDVLAHARPGCEIRVDWTLRGVERQFRYGEVGSNVWNLIFDPLHEPEEVAAPGNDVLHLRGRLNPYFLSRARDILARDRRFPGLRVSLNRIITERVHIHNQFVLSEVESYRGRMAGRLCLGVHKRLSIPSVADNQESFRMPSNEDVLEAVQEIMRRSPELGMLVYLATDDADCVEIFSRQFGQRLICRPDVQRVRAGDKVEVHCQEWGRVSLKDACDVLIDGLILAQCTTVLHLSSNITTCVAFLNPQLKLIHYDELRTSRQRRSSEAGGAVGPVCDVASR